MRRKIQRSVKHHENTSAEVETFHDWLETLIERYTESGLLNDSLYSFSRVRSLRNKGTSERMIYAKLMQKGLSKDSIQLALLEYNDREADGKDPKDIERAAADKYARKRRFGPHRPIPDPERADKDLAAMARAGFSYEIIRSVLKDDRET